MEKLLNKLLKYPLWQLGLFLVVIASLYEVLYLQDKSEFRQAMKSEANLYFSNFKTSLDMRLYAMDRMASRFSRATLENKSKWKEDAQNYIDHFKGFQAIEWADIKSKVQWVHPLEGNEAALGLVLNAEGRRDDAINYAHDHKLGSLTKSIDLKQGGRGFLSLHPTRNQDKVNGYMIGVYKSDDLIRLFLNEKFNLKVFLSGEGIFSSFVEDFKFDEFVFSQKINMRNVNFEIAVQPSEKLMSRYTSVRNEKILSFLVIFMIGLAGIYASYRNKILKLEKDLEISEKNTYFNLAMEASELGVWDWYLKDNSVKFDRRWAEMLGLDFDTLPMELSTWEDRVHPDDIKQCYDDLQAYLNGKTSMYRNVHRMKHVDGSWVYILDQGKISRYDDDGNPLRFTGTHLDITDQKFQEEQKFQAMVRAEEAERAKAEFLANMSHEIRTPMNGVLGMVQLLSETKLTSEQRDMVDTVKTSGDSLLEILNDILDLSKIDSGKIDLEVTDFSLIECIESAISLSLPRAKEKGVELMFRPSPLLPKYFLGDTTRIRQIVFNYISNAIKFTENGRVQIFVDVTSNDQSKAMVKISVKDTGIGISEENQQRLFNAFVQADPTTTRKFGGTGLGLSICRKLAEVMQGSVGMESKEGEGSTFWVELKLGISSIKSLGEENDSKTSATISAVGLGEGDFKHKILLVEDSVLNQKVAKLMFNKMGLECDTAFNGLEAIEAVKNIDYTIIFMDMRMPEMDGPTATKEIINLLGASSPPIVAMTANAFEEDKKICFEAGMVDFLSKPVKIHALREIILKYSARVEQDTHSKKSA